MMMRANIQNTAPIGAINIALVIIALLQAIFLSDQTPRLQSTHHKLLIEGSFVSLVCFLFMFFWTTKHLKRKYGCVWNSTKVKRPEDWLILTITVISLIVGFQGYPTWVYASPLPISATREVIMMKVISKHYPSSSQSSWCHLKLQYLQDQQDVDTLTIDRSSCPRSENIESGTELKLITTQKFDRYPVVLQWQLINSN